MSSVERTCRCGREFLADKGGDRRLCAECQIEERIASVNCDRPPELPPDSIRHRVCADIDEGVRVYSHDPAYGGKRRGREPRGGSRMR